MDSVLLCNRERRSLSDEQLEKLSIYASTIERWNGLGLVAKSSVTDIYGWHILDALSIWGLLEHETRPIVDFGAGAGVLGVSLSCVGVGNITCAERSRTKSMFLRDIVKFNSVFEGDDFDVFNDFVCIVRGVGSISSVLNALGSKVKRAVFFKSQNVECEIAEAMNWWDFDATIYNRTARAWGKIAVLDDIVGCA